MKKNFILKFVLICISLCISLNARTQTTTLPSSFTKTSAPTGEVRFPAEFEPVQAVIIAHMEGDNLPVRFIKEMAKDCKVITIVDQNKYTDYSSVQTIYTNGGVDLDNCEFVMAPLDGRWTRDYSPWIVFNGTTPAIVDNIYNRVYTGTNDKSQINDDNISNVLYNKWKTEYPNLELYGMDVVHTGGNMMQDGYGNGVSDDIVYSESYKYLGLSEDEVDQKMKDYLGIDPYHVTIDPQGDYVAHVDCWGKFLAPDKILLAKVHQNHPRAKEYQQVANYFENTNCCWGYPYKVHYVELPDGVETNTTVMAPYTNSLILNKKVFVPLDSEVGGTYNADAIALYESLMPGYEIIPFECNSNQFDPNTDLNNWYGWRNTDALHCRTHEVMDFNMLFADHRDVLWGKQENQASYPISAKFIAYSGNAITETKLHYSTDNGSTYTTVDMQHVGTTNEYTADIPGNHQEGTVIKYYITGKDASGRECVQPTFGKDEPHEFEVGTPEAIQPSTEAITLTADKTTITANGTDAITFTAMQGTTDITLLAEYYIGEEKIRSPYKTTTAETYEVYAKYNGVTSNTINITAKAVVTTTDDVVTIDGTVGGFTPTYTNTIPIYAKKKYSISQQYYTKEEINRESGTITKIGFKTEMCKTTFSRNIEIYIKNTKDSRFSTNSSSTSTILTDNAKVFSGTVEFNAGDTWFTIDLDSNFEYSGNDILVCVNDITGSAADSDLYFYKFSVNGDKSRALAGNNSLSQYTPADQAYSCTLYTNIPCIQLTFGDASSTTPEPIVLSADKTTFTANGTDAVTFSVKQGSGTNETEVTNDCEIWYTIGTSAAVKITGNTFSTTTAGEYTFYAKKGTLTSDPITITAEAPAVIKPVIDLTKYYRIKVNSGTYKENYLNVYNYNTRPNNSGETYVNVTASNNDNIFQIEKSNDGGDYYLKCINGNYIKCDDRSNYYWGVYAYSTSDKTPLIFDYVDESSFYIRNYYRTQQSKSDYFKVENGTVYCDAPKTLEKVVTWVLEEVSNFDLTVTPATATISNNETIQFEATASGGIGNYTYRWSPGNGLDNASSATPTFTPTKAGTYTFTCTATDSGNNKAYKDVTITVKEASNVLPTAGKYYRIKVHESSPAQYLNIYNYDTRPNSNSTYANVVTSKSDNNIFKIEDAGNGNYYLRCINNKYIKCDDRINYYWSVFAYSTSERTPLTFEYISNSNNVFYIRDYDKTQQSKTDYFKVENNYVYCNAAATDGNVVKWVLEEVNDEFVTIGSPSQTTDNRLPIHNNYEYSISQQYYTAAELGNRDNGNISKIAFRTADDQGLDGSEINKYPYTRDITIYMVNTTDSHFSGVQMQQIDVNTQVFSGEVTFTENSWVEIELETLFVYEGNNVLVCVTDNTGEIISNGGTYFATFECGKVNDNWRTLRTSNTKNSYNPTTSQITGSGSEMASCIQFTFAVSNIILVNPTISVDKTRFTADNSDYVKFTVTPADAEIWYTSGTQETQLTTTDKSFKTSNAGTYSFYATKDGVSSDPITVEAVAEKELTLTLSTNNIVANGIDEVTFTVKQVDVNGTEQDVTNNCTFKINGTAITGNTFFTNRAGEYTVTATKGTKTATATLTATAVSGEENVVLIDGNVIQPADQSYNYSLTNPLSVPVNNYYSYSISQQYYTKGEIGKDEGVITHIAFKTAKTAGTYTRDIEVYMVNADESTFSSKELKQMSGTNIVYSGKVQFSSNSWITLPLSSSFKYTGKNVLICVNDKTGTKETYLTSHFDAYALGSNVDRVVYMHSDNMLDPTDANTGNTFVYFAPFVKFTFEQELPIVLEGSKQIVKADGSDIIRFSVKQGGNYVTGKTKIYVEQYEGSTIISTTVLNDTTFATSNVGTYRAYAKKDDLTSNNVEFTSVYPIVLTADKTTIIADGNDAVKFTLMQNDIDVTTAEGTVIYVGNNVITNTFATSTMGTYMAYATRDGIRSNGIEITVNDKNYDGSEGVAGGSENEYYNGDGSITYNKGEENEYTLIAKKINNTTAYIKQDNVKVNATGDYYWRFDQNKPHAETILTIPEKILFGDEWITITKIEDFAFSDKCDLSEDGRQVFEPGNPLNSNFTGVIIPSTITEIGTYTFGFTIEEYVICFAKTPPALSETTVNNPFYKNTYDNVILYVPAESIEAYRNALGWGAPFMGGDEYYFKNIYPITMPTYVEKEKDNLIWDNENNWRTYVKIDDDNYEERYGVMPEEGVDVLIDGNVRITNGCEANVGAVHIITGSITIADGGQLIHTNAGVNVTLEKEIIGYHESTSPTSWYTISSPLFNSVKASSVINLLENDYDLYRYDEPTHYWDNIEDPEGLGGGPVGAWETLDAGRGYLYANQENVTLQFKGVANHIGGTYNLTRDVWDGVLIGFHLVGNPFTHDIYMNNAFDTEATLADGYYILSNTGAWGANLGSNTPIKPCQGVLIKAMTEGTLTINKKVGTATEAQTRSRFKDEFIAISVANKNYEDKAYVSFNAENPLEKVNHQNKDIPMVYIPMEEDNYAIATMDKDVKEIPVAFEAKTMGQYTIAATAENCEFKNMHLVDRMTGIETNLLLESYTFMATTTDNSKRFIIKLSNNDLDTENFIFINNNEMIINNIEGKGVLQIFDVMGRYISHTEVSGSANISTEAFTSGVYIIRMTDDNGVKTQKVVLY